MTVKILCVDDEPNMLKTLQRSLRKDGFKILVADSAQKGLDILRESGPVQVIISDFRMPGINGVNFLREVHRCWPETVGILVSGFADLPVVTSALDECFIFRHISKPWGRNELKDAIDAALDHHLVAVARGDFRDSEQRKKDTPRTFREN